MQANLVAGFSIVAIVATIAACNRYDVIPDHLEQRVNKNLFYQDIAHAAAAQQGQLVVLGGKVLSTTRLDERTQIEVLQLPLTDDHIPLTDQETQSQGRFYAYDSGKEILDPATLPEGTPVTIVGEVSGTQVVMVDEVGQPIPTLDIKDLTKWEVSEVRRGWGAPYYGGYMYGARPYGFYYR